ncbi:hypothetical protein OPV22_033963 [Ensete ventricosum]|uniref:CDP-diacylglycerol--glycerol-3-phosphate 3-phosphatidyltransferase n=1 Tax=Ensete ventricosum TaxID=4639 RepID=A0AAV8Q0X3_ENSVE|nr:hypothetical protein OPV22_033963 [Ensete ventricosum]
MARARKQAGRGPGETNPHGDAASAIGSLYECGGGKVGMQMSGQKQPPPSTPPMPQNGAGRLLTLPTVLTIGRVAAVPLFVSTFYMDGWWGATATTSIFLLAAITDWLDGYIARKMRLETAFGAFLDPVADKLMVAATLVLLCTKPFECAIFGDVPWLLTAPSITIIGREITMSAVREWAASQNSLALEAVAVNKLGKWKTATQMTALTALLASRDPSMAGPSVLASGIGLLYVSAGLSVWHTKNNVDDAPVTIHLVEACSSSVAVSKPLLQVGCRRSKLVIAVDTYRSSCRTGSVQARSAPLGNHKVGCRPKVQQPSAIWRRRLPRILLRDAVDPHRRVIPRRRRRPMPMLWINLRGEVWRLISSLMERK